LVENFADSSRSALSETLPDDLAHERAKPTGDFARRIGEAFSKRQGAKYGSWSWSIEKAGLLTGVQQWRVSVKPLFGGKQ
jgi:hypothetical protein